MSDELVADMRRRAEEADWPAPEVISGWADRIEADARRIAELEGLVKEARHMAQEIVDSGGSYGSVAYAQRVDSAARALLARMGGSDGSA